MYSFQLLCMLVALTGLESVRHSKGFLNLQKTVDPTDTGTLLDDKLETLEKKINAAFGDSTQSGFVTKLIEGVDLTTYQLKKRTIIEEQKYDQKLSNLDNLDNVDNVACNQQAVEKYIEKMEGPDDLNQKIQDLNKEVETARQKAGEVMTEKAEHVFKLKGMVAVYNKLVADAKLLEQTINTDNAVSTTNKPPDQTPQLLRQESTDISAQITSIGDHLIGVETKEMNDFKNYMIKRNLAWQVAQSNLKLAEEADERVNTEAATINKYLKKQKKEDEFKADMDLLTTVSKLEAVLNQVQDEWNSCQQEIETAESRHTQKLQDQENEKEHTREKRKKEREEKEKENRELQSKLTELQKQWKEALDASDEHEMNKQEHRRQKDDVAKLEREIKNTEKKMKLNYDLTNAAKDLGTKNAALNTQKAALTTLEKKYNLDLKTLEKAVEDKETDILELQTLIAAKAKAATDLADQHEQITKSEDEVLYVKQKTELLATIAEYEMNFQKCKEKSFEEAVNEFKDKCPVSAGNLLEVQAE